MLGFSLISLGVCRILSFFASFVARYVVHIPVRESVSSIPVIMFCARLLSFLSYYLENKLK